MSPVGPDAPATLLHAAEVFEKGAAWQRVVQAFQNFQRRYPKAGDPEQVVVAHVRAGRAENALGHAEAARASYSRAVSEFDRRGLEPAANPAGAAAAAEARFRLVEHDLQRFDPTALPSTSQASKLEKALKAQLAETNKLSTRYEEVKRFRSPDWTVAATYRQGYLADRFARTLHDAPIPPEFKKAGQEEYLAAYREQLATFARPYEEQAVEAYTRASRLAQELRVESEWSRRVAERLAQLPRAKGRYLPDDPPRPDEQEQRARTALSEGAPDVAAMVDLANVALARRRIELARAILARAQEVAPDDATVWNALGRVDLALEARMKAEARWKKAIELTPGHADALTNHGQLLVEAGDFAGAAALLKQAVRSAPASAPSWLDLGNAYRGMARFDDAVRAYERALALDAMLVDARSNLELLRREGARPTGGVP
jgi:Flp pilus assembly protein TadD